MTKEKIKNALIISLFSFIIGTFQMYWFLPDGLSCIDAKSGIIEAVFKFMSIQALIVFLIYATLIFNISRYISFTFLLFYWFFINKNEFTNRHACWSTFSNTEITYHSLYKSIIPIVTCLIIFVISVYLYKSKSKKIQ